ncbi:hypothetical protein [Mycobacterium sp. Lab-001]|uniref:hypothetical protein n=1 Tax=Mycobacterium sp. Lab-001 TaxID=3410136 RepID=UPI003D16C62D
MTVGSQARYDIGVLDALARRAVVGDGVTGTRPQAADLGLDDFGSRRSPRSRRNMFDCHLVRVGNDEIADTIRKPALEGSAMLERVGSSWASRRRVTT